MPTDSDRQLRSALATAVVTEVAKPPFQTRSSAGIFIVTLAGDVPAFWKRGDMDPPGEAGVLREVAAYELALLLGWDDLLMVTALRVEPVEGGGQAQIASVALLPDGREGLAVSEFDSHQVERAGVFDALIANPDRSGHNWRGIPRAAGGYDLKLYDHELAFRIDGNASSSFWSEIGQSVSAELRQNLAAAHAAVQSSGELSDLLSREEFEALLQRFIRLADSE